MTKTNDRESSESTTEQIVRSYRLEDQIGFLLRKANQHHTYLFSQNLNADLTPTQFAVLAKLFERGSVSQNRLGRLTAMDVATIKGVIDRLRERGLARTRKDRNDKRRLLVELTDEGKDMAFRTIPAATEITKATLQPLKTTEKKLLAELLKKIS
jgi:DNA-binding MarR family transcriptional regulator